MNAESGVLMCSVTKLFELIQLAPDRNLVAAASDSQQNLLKLGTTSCRLPYVVSARPMTCKRKEWISIYNSGAKSQWHLVDRVPKED